MTLEIGVWTVRIAQNFKGSSFRREELYLKRRDRPIKRTIVIDGHDHASVDQIVASV